MAEEQFELRIYVPLRVVEIVDALVQANPGSSRGTFLAPVLEQWADRRVHESTLVLNIAKRNAGGTQP